MGIKYRCQYKAFDNTNWKIELSLGTYAAAVINLASVSEQPCIPQYDSIDSEDIYSAFVKSTVTLNFYNVNNQIDISELQLAKDMDFTVVVYKENNIYWKGYLLPDGIQRPFTGSVEAINLKATDGLALLDDMFYLHKDLPVDTANTINVRCPLNYMRQILFSDDNLGMPLPIRWSNNLKCIAFDDDMFAGQLAWSVNDAGFYSYQSGATSDTLQPKTCAYILQGFMKATGCRLYQAAGRWNIRRINLLKPSTYKQVPSSLGNIVITTGSENIAKSIGTGSTGSYPFIKEDAVIMVDPGLKSCSVTYEANVPENILPNGGQDKVTAVVPIKPLYWGFPDDILGLGISHTPIDGRIGYSTEVYNPEPDSAYFVFNPVSETLFGLPLDAKVLVPKIQFGFIFSVVSGFPFNIDGSIDFTDRPLKIQVILNTYFGTWYLNENGFWVSANTYIGIVPDTPIVPGDSVRIDFNRFQGILLPEPPDELDHTKEYNIKIRFVAARGTLGDGQFYLVDNIYLNIDQNNDIYEAGITNTSNTKTEEVSLDISSSFGGYMVSNFMTSFIESGREFEFTDGAFLSGSLTAILARARMRCKYQPQRKIDLTVNVRDTNWTFDEVYSVVTFGTSTFIPVKASYNTDTCEVKMTIIECRNDDIALYTKHYGSNDTLLSN